MMHNTSDDDPYRDVELKLSPAMLLNLKGVNCDLPCRVWEGRMQVENHLGDNHPVAGIPFSLWVQCLVLRPEKNQARTHLLDDVTYVLSVQTSDVQIPLVGLCFGGL